MIAVIIPTWNTRDITMKCLRSIERVASMPTRVVVVDNGSDDGTAVAVNLWREGMDGASLLHVSMIRLPENRGWPAAVNAGAASVFERGADDAKALVLLNSDTEVCRGWDEELAAALHPGDNARVAAAGPVSNYVSGPQKDPEARYFSRTDMEAYAAKRRERFGGLTHTYGRLVGFCLAINPAAWLEVGGFDESFGLGNFDDDDWCRRATAAGWQLVIALGAFVHHVGHVTWQVNGLDFGQAMARGRARYEQKYPQGEEVPAA